MTAFKKAEVIKTVGGQLVHTDIGMHTVPSVSENAPLIVELVPSGHGSNFFVPAPSAGQTVKGYDYVNTTKADPTIVGLSDSTDATGSHVPQIVQVQHLGGAHSNVPTGRVPGASVNTPQFQYLSMVMIVAQRNADGSVKRDENGRALVALDASGNPMIGPLVVQWVPNSVPVYSAGPANGVGDGVAAGELLTGVTAGAFVTGGGGSAAGSCNLCSENTGLVTS
jgi:hypothetical protein